MQVGPYQYSDQQKAPVLVRPVRCINIQSRLSPLMPPLCFLNTLFLRSMLVVLIISYIFFQERREKKSICLLMIRHKIRRKESTAKQFVFTGSYPSLVTPIPPFFGQLQEGGRRNWEGTSVMRAGGYWAPSQQGTSPRASPPKPSMPPPWPYHAT